MKKNVNIGYLVFLSFVAALGGFLFGYDTAVISGTIAQVTVLFHLDTLQQGWYVGCALVMILQQIFINLVLKNEDIDEIIEKNKDKAAAKAAKRKEKEGEDGMDV